MGFFSDKKEKKKPVNMKPLTGNYCPKCGDTLYKVEGVNDVTLWCMNCGWKQIDYTLNKPSIF